MLKQQLLACAIAALVASPVLAQTTQPSTKAPPASDVTKAAPAAGQTTVKVEYITRSEPNLVRATKLDGVDVYNEQNERIGDVKEVLLDTQGKAKAVVIGVGGFLGIGDRDVAVPYEALQWQMSATETRTTTTVPAASPKSATSQTTTTAPATSPPAKAPAATTTTSGAATANRDVPARAILPGATKDQLKQAPEYKYPG